MASTSVNTVAISGNLTRDAELRPYGDGSQGVLRFSVAVTERRKSRDGEWEDYPSFIDCVMFGSRAPKLSEWLTRGKRVCVQGSLRQDRWEGEGGERRSRVEVVVSELVFMSSQDGQGRGGAGQAVAPDVYETDVPF